MTAIPQSRVVSNRLESPLKQVARRQWSVLAAKGVIQTLLASLAIILVAMLIISFIPTMPLWARIAAAVVVWGSVLTCGIYFLRPAMKRRSLVATAMDVERAMAAGQIDTQERITSSLELSQETDLRFAGSQAMIDRLHRQAETDAAAIVPEKLIPAGSVGKLALLLIPLLAIWLFLAFYLPPSKFLRPLFNLLMPWQETPAFLSDVVVTPGSFTIAQGDPIEISVRVNPRDQEDKNRKIERAVMEMKDLATGQVSNVALGRVGPRDFKFAQPANRSFSYRITTDGGDSTSYVATVEPVPAIESLAVRYDYPAYTQLPSRVDVNKDDSAIDAIQGTKVTLTVTTSAKDLTAASQIVITEPIISGETELPPAAAAAAAKRIELPLTKIADGQYEATHTIQNAGSYVVELINTYNRTNRERQERSITVHFDAKPQVTVTSPTADLTVRPTETVPVAFQASDDFGLATVELMTQVEGGEVKATPVALDSKWPRNLAMGTPLSVANAISASGISDAKRIQYWIRVTDNRAPDGQVAESNHQTLRLDSNVESLAARQDRQDAKDFTEAIRVAIRGLEQAHPVVDRVRAIDTDRVNLRPDERRNVEDGKERLEKIASNLTKEANENLYGPYAAMALTAKEISETRILGAAGRMAKFDLHADQPDLRKLDATESLKQVSTAKKELEELLKKVEEQAKLVNAQHKLEDLARKQEEVAQQMAQQQQEGKPNREQKSLKDQTQQVVNETPQLQNKEALAQAQALNELINEVTQLQEKQDKAIEQNQKQAELAEAAEEAKGIAEMQQALNEKIEQFKKEDAKPLEQAKAQPPEQKQLENIVKELNAAKLQQAAQQQMDAAKKLEQNAQQLEQQAKMKPEQAAEQNQQAAKEAMAQAQQAMAEAKQAAQQAQQAAEQAKVAEQAAKEATKRQQEAAKAEQQAKQASAEAAKAAAKPNNADAQKDAAQKAADAAMAAKKLADQAEVMAKDVQKQAEAAQKNPAAKDNKPMQQAAKKAQDAAKKADDMADQAQAAADQAQQAAQQAAQAQQQKKPDQAKTATAEAAKKATEAGEKAEEAAKAAAEAGQQMAEAQKQAVQQAQAQAKAQQQKAQGMQQQAQAKQQAAEQAMQQQPEQAGAQQAAAEEAKALAEEQKALAQQAQQQAQAMAEAQKQGAIEPKAAAAQQQQIGQQAQKAAQKAQQLAQQAEKTANANLAQRAEMAQQALDQAQAAQAQAAKAQEQGNNEQAAGAQEAAQNALARAEQALRGQQQMAQAEQPQGQPGEEPQGEQAAGEPAPAEGAQPGEMAQGKPSEPKPAEGQPAEGQPGEGQPGEGQPGEAQAGQPQQGQPGQGQPGQGQPAQQQAAMAEPHPGEPGMVNEGQSAQAGQPQTPQQAMQQAAQAAAEATAAQGQAAQGNQAAAQQAAQALAQAAQALAQAAGQGQPGQGQAQAQAPAPGEGQASEMPSPVPGQSGDPKKGIAAQLDGGSNAVPDAIGELGIHPGDWAKLGPLQQRELLNAAQQAGPPEYQAMIRNYYIRLARMQSKPAE